MVALGQGQARPRLGQGAPGLGELSLRRLGIDRQQDLAGDDGVAGR